MDKGGNGSWGKVFMGSSLEHSCLVHSEQVYGTLKKIARFLTYEDLKNVKYYTIKEAASMTGPPNPSIPEHHSSQFSEFLDGVLASKEDL